MNSFAAIILLSAMVVLAAGAPSQYSPPAYGGSYGHVPALPPFGAAAKHPKYGYGSYGGYGDSKYSPEYVTALRYESSTYAPNGIESAWAYDVDGQRVQVARVDPAYKSY